MSWNKEVVIPSLGGLYSRILSDRATKAQLQDQHGDNIYVITLLVTAWVSLLADSPSDAIKPNCVINRFLTELVSDTFGCIARLSSLAHKLTVSVKRTEQDDSIIIDEFLDDFKDTPIFREYLEFYRTKDVSLMVYILTFLSFGKKVSYVDPSLDSEALRSWIEVEDHLERLALPSFTDDLSYVMDWLFASWSDGAFLPKHGSGAVSEKGLWGSEQKNEAMTFDPKISYLYGSETSEFNDLGYCSPASTPLVTKDPAHSVARLMFVPKDWRKTRSICMEPVDHQWAQQGVRLWYEEYLEQSPLKNHIFIKDQTRNQRLAYYGSLHGTMDTLDLSSASDCVLLTLVKRIYKPAVLKHLLATRSRLVQLPGNGGIRRVHKFAPMGSALCFPVQSTIYSAIIIMVSIAEVYGRNLWAGDTITDLDLDEAYHTCYASYRSRLWKPAFTRFLAYGDDLIVDNAITSNTVRALTDFGFFVNEEKSFVGESAYRESCGKHYCLGVDVTPYTLKVKWFNQGISADALGSAIAAANLALDYGYIHLRKCLVNFILHYRIEGVRKVLGKNPVLFVETDSEESYALRCSNPRNTHLQRRDFDLSRWAVLSQYSDDTRVRFQRDEVSSITIGPHQRKELSGKYDNYHYLVWWRSRYRGYENDVYDVSATADTKGVRIRRRWTAV